MKSPPKNLDKPEQERFPREVSIIAEDSSSEESEAWGNAIGADRHRSIRICERSTDPTENAIGEGKDAIERNMYIGKHRSPQTVKIIGGPDKMNQIYRDIPIETTKEVLYEMGRADEMYYGPAIQ